MLGRKTCCSCNILFVHKRAGRAKRVVRPLRRKAKYKQPLLQSSPSLVPVERFRVSSVTLLVMKRHLKSAASKFHGSRMSSQYSAFPYCASRQRHQSDSMAQLSQMLFWRQTLRQGAMITQEHGVALAKQNLGRSLDCRS